MGNDWRGSGPTMQAMIGCHSMHPALSQCVLMPPASADWAATRATWVDQDSKCQADEPRATDYVVLAPVADYVRLRVAKGVPPLPMRSCGRRVRRAAWQCQRPRRRRQMMCSDCARGALRVTSSTHITTPHVSTLAQHFVAGPGNSWSPAQ